MRFREFITESKNTHLTHLEDLILKNGSKGVDQVIDYIENVTSVLSGHGDRGNVNVKLDGSPAIIAGNDPEDGKFFIGTKSVFAKSPKLVKNKYDLDRWYGEKPELYQKLYTCLKYLKTLNIDGVLQGDLLFTADDLKQDTINGEECIIFKPNTIVYAVPVDSNLAKIITKSKMGIAWHTMYEGGPSLQDMRANYNIIPPQSNSNVWSRGVNFKDLTGIATLTPKEMQIVTNSVEKLRNLRVKMNDKLFDKVTQDQQFMKIIEPFINSRIRAGKDQVHTDIHEFIKDFIKYYENKVMNGVDNLRGGLSGVAGKRRQNKVDIFKDFVRDNYQTILALLGIYKFVIGIKRILIRKMSVLDGIKTFNKTATGYQITGDEGFVAVDHSNNAVKLVNRLEFSRRNFNKYY